MNRWVSIFPIVVVVALTGGCEQGKSSLATSSGVNPASAPTASSDAASFAAADTLNLSDHDAIAEAIRKHLAGNSTINMAVMDMDVSQVSINRDQAQANTDFRLKQGGTTMQMIYFLERHAGTWIVLRSQPAGGQFAHPPLDKTHSGAAQGPSHPAIPNIRDFFKDAPASAGAENSPSPAGTISSPKTSP